MSELKFETPPEKTRVTWGRHYLVAHELKAKPGEWAVVGVYNGPECAGSIARQIKGARLSAYQPAGSFEAEARTVDGEHRVYARFVGEKEYTS
jgi:hypothetical protein